MRTRDSCKKNQEERRTIDYDKGGRARRLLLAS